MIILLTFLQRTALTQVAWGVMPFCPPARAHPIGADRDQKGCTLVDLGKATAQEGARGWLQTLDVYVWPNVTYFDSLDDMVYELRRYAADDKLHVQTSDAMRAFWRGAELSVQVSRKAPRTLIPKP